MSYALTRLSAIAIAGLASGCTSTEAARSTIPQQMHHISLALEKAGHPSYPMARPGTVLPLELQRPASWHWKGPLTEAIAILGGEVGYVPSVPTRPSGTRDPIIAIDLDDVTLGDLIAEAADAGADSADITTDTEAHTIRIQWHG